MLRLIRRYRDKQGKRRNRQCHRLDCNLKKSINLWSTGADLFADNYGPQSVDSLPPVSANAKAVLSDVAPASFRSPYQ
jgi:hypothetical protein